VVRNATHFIIIDVEEIQEMDPYVRWNVPFMINGEWATGLHYVWSSWRQTGCPRGGWHCPHGERANMWACWRNWDEEHMYMSPWCFPVGDKHVNRTRITLVPNDVLDAETTGVHIHYDGWWGMGISIRADCNLERNSTDLDVPMGESLAVWRNNPFGFVFQNMTSRYVCPFPYVTHTKETEPRPPSPGENPPTKWETQIGEWTVGIDLAQLTPQITKNLLFGRYRSHEYGINDIVYSPVTKIGCPSGKDCGAYQTEQANVWRCVGTDQHDCFPIGDLSYGLNFSLRNSSEPHSGIVAHYLGGANEWTTNIVFICSDDMTPGNLSLNEDARTVGLLKVANIHAYSKDACPKGGPPVPSPYPTYTPGPGPLPTTPPGPGPITQSPTPTKSGIRTMTPMPTPSQSERPPPPTETRTRYPPHTATVRAKVTGGSVFLLVVGGSLFLWFVLGLMIMMMCGKAVSVPFQNFLEEFAVCVKTGFYFLVCCCNMPPEGQQRLIASNYDKI
jgi:hypothetical protein